MLRMVAVHNSARGNVFVHAITGLLM